MQVLEVLDGPQTDPKLGQQKHGCDAKVVASEVPVDIVELLLGVQTVGCQCSGLASKLVKYH